MFHPLFNSQNQIEVLQVLAQGHICVQARIKLDLVVWIIYRTFGTMIKAVLTLVALTLVVASIVVNLFNKMDAVKKYKFIGGLLYVAIFLLSIANSLTLEGWVIFDKMVGGLTITSIRYYFIV